LRSPSDSNLSMVSPVVASRPRSSASWWSTVCTAGLCLTGFRHEAASTCVGAAASSTAGRQSCSAAIDACNVGRYKHHKRHKTACYFPSKQGQLFALVTKSELKESSNMRVTVLTAVCVSSCKYAFPCGNANSTAADPRGVGRSPPLDIDQKKFHSTT